MISKKRKIKTKKIIKKRLKRIVRNCSHLSFDKYIKQPHRLHKETMLGKKRTRWKKERKGMVTNE